MSISYALALTESVRHKLYCAANDPSNRANTPDEVGEGDAEKKKAIAALESSIVVVNQTLNALRKDSKKTAASANEVRDPKKDLKLLHAEAAHTGSMLRTRASPAANDPALEAVKKAMSAEGLAPGVKGLKDMANAVEPIVDKFDEVLKQPYLKNYSATLNTVPVVGLKGTNIMYVETKPNARKRDGVDYAWSYFSALPTNAQVTPTTKIYMFPYEGDFYLSVGASVWKKEHIQESDTSDMKGAVDHWPSLYHKDWVHVGDSVLPASDLAGVVPFAILSADNKEIGFHLVALAADGTLSYLANDSIAPGNTYEPLRFPSSSPPKWSRLAYWNGHLIGVDDLSNSWNIAPDWLNSSYTISNQAPIDPVSEFTANDAGPISLRSDGYLWTRIVEAPPPGSDEDAKLKWSRWLKADGVTNLGVASPGVLLDMDLLTTTLRSRYIDVQTSVYPVVDRLRAFGLTHVFWLKSVAKDAEDWKIATGSEQQALAIKNAKSFVTHSKTWSKIVSGSISGARDDVNIMASQLQCVRHQLEHQLGILKTKLVGLKATLEAQEGVLSNLNAAFWGSIAATFVGVALAIVGLVIAQPSVVIGAGLLFVGGLVATIVLTVRIGELAASIADTEAQIREVNTAIEQLSMVVTSFADLDNLYGILNEFWGRMANDASSIKSMDEVTAVQIGTEILEDTSSIEAALDMTKQLSDACQTYLDVLNKQGIKIPESALQLQAKSSTRAKENEEVDLLLVKASRAIRDDEVALYQSLMVEATLASMQHAVNVHKAIVATGMWFDVAALSSTASIWLSSRAFTRAVDLPASLRTVIDAVTHIVVGAADSLDGSLNEVRPYIQRMLTDIISMGEAIQCWTKEFPKLPTNEVEKAKFEKLQKDAISTCSAAQSKARLAINKFADFTNQAREYQQGLGRDIREKEDSIDSEKRRAQVELNNLNPPWSVWLGGAIAVTTWMVVEKNLIKRRLSDTLNFLNASIAQSKRLKDSGLSFNAHAQTWINMSQRVSTNLATVYNIMTGMWGQLIENPDLYKEFLVNECGDLVQNARDVLQILDSGSSSRAISVSLRLAVPRSLAKTATTSKGVVLGALSPNSALAPGLSAQAKSASEVFSSFNKLLVSPYLKDIIGYWAQADTERKTLFDVVTSLRTEYVQMVATEYDTIQELSSLAILQEYRAKNVIEDNIPLEHFVQSTFHAVNGALRAAERTSGKFGSAAKQFQSVLSVIDNNIKEITKNIDGLTTDLDKLDVALRDEILWIIADTIAIAFAAAAALVAFGVVGPVGAALTLAAQVGATATATAASIKLVLDSLSLADIVKTIAALKATRNSLNTSVEELKVVKPLFCDVVDGVNSLKRMITDMHETLAHVLSQIELISGIVFTAEDALKLKDSWSSVGAEAKAWMDVINAQGISRTTFSVIEKH